MKKTVTFAVIAAAFLLGSGLLYLIHYLIFHDTHHIFIYLVGDLAFLPLEVLLVGLVIERLLHRREKQALLQKLSMVVGVFYSEVGNKLLAELVQRSEGSADIKQHFGDVGKWTRQDFKRARAFAQTIKVGSSVNAVDLDSLRGFLKQKRPLMLGLLENPNLLEHESFTDMLLAIFHLEEELEARQSLKGLPESDLKHIAGDIERAFVHLALEWLAYTEHLKSDYPFLFSLVSRTHPFRDHPTAIVQ